MTNLFDTMQAEGTLTTFIHALKMGDLAVPLRERGAYTVFAPNDAAFAQMKAEKRVDLFNSYYDLNKMVKYHVVQGIYTAEDLLNMFFLKTMEGQRLAIRSSAVEEARRDHLADGSHAHSYVVRDTVTTTLLESIKVNGAHIIRANGRANNGIVHVIDRVLMPRFTLA